MGHNPISIHVLASIVFLVSGFKPIYVPMLIRASRKSRDHSLLWLLGAIKRIRNAHTATEVKMPDTLRKSIGSLASRLSALLTVSSAIALISSPAISQAQLYPSASGSEFAPVFNSPPSVSIDAATGCPVASFYLNGFSRNANNSATQDSSSNQNQFDNYGLVGGISIPFAPKLMLNCRNFMQGVVARQGLLRKSEIATFCATLLSNKTFAFDLSGYVESLPMSEREDFKVCRYISVKPEGKQDSSQAWGDGPLRPYGADDAKAARTLQILVPSK